jgi:hypothetical protein
LHFSVKQKHAINRLSKTMRCSAIILSAACCFLWGETAGAAEVPQTAPKALNETQDKDAVDQHDKAAQADVKKGVAPVVPPAWTDEIREMATAHSQREAMPAEKLDVIFKKNGGLASLQVLFARSATRTPNDANQMHGVCGASFDGKGDKLKMDVEGAVDGPDLYELFGIDQLPIVFKELIAIRRLQQAFAKNDLDYTLEARVIVAPDGKSWAWEIAPSEEQSPNIIYGLYYYPISRELHSIHLDKGKAAARLQRAAKDAGMQLKWVADMNNR